MIVPALPFATDGRRPALRAAGAVAVAGMLAFEVAGCSIGGSKGTVTLGYLPAWSEGRVTAGLITQQLERRGYTVESTVYSDVDDLYDALGAGDIDLYPSAWPDRTQKQYAEEAGNDIESLGSFYDHAAVFLAVPADAPVDSIADLAGRGAEFRGEVVGIEPDAGITRLTEETLVAYGLDSEYELRSQSTAHMVSALQTADSAGENIVVAMWAPFWPNTTMDLERLDDPLGAMGAEESLHFLANAEFNESFPELAEWLGKVSLDEAQYADLEQAIVHDFPAAEANRAVRSWLRDHPDVLPDWD